MKSGVGAVSDFVTVVLCVGFAFGGLTLVCSEVDINMFPDVCATRTKSSSTVAVIDDVVGS